MGFSNPRLVELLARVVVSSGLERSLRRHRRNLSDFRAFILAYHDLAGPDGAEVEGTVRQDRFREHVRYLVDQYEIVTIAGLAERLSRRQPLERDLVAITFDDGYRGVHDFAWPVLRSSRIPATVFLTTGFLDGHALWFDQVRRFLRSAHEHPGSVPDGLARQLGGVLSQWPPLRNVETHVNTLKYLEPKERDHLVKAMEQSDIPLPARVNPLEWAHVRTMFRQGIEFGAHTVTHPILSLLPRPVQESEIRSSIHRVEDETGTRPRSFAFPNGSIRDFDLDTLSVLREQHIEAACTTIRGSNSWGSNLLQLKRIGVGSDSLALLRTRLTGLLDEQTRRVLRLLSHLKVF